MQPCFPWRLAWLAVVIFLPVAAFAQPLQKAVSVPTAKTLALEDGTVIRLAALQAPNPQDPLSGQALATLELLALNRPLRIEPLGKAPDRHGRTVAMAYREDGSLLQSEMLRAGMGWAYTFPDSRKHAATLLAAESEAEKAGRGVWAHPDYAVLKAEKADGHAGEFRLVHGKVQNAAQVRGRYYLNFGDDWKTDFTVTVERNSLKHFDKAWLETLPGKTVRIRGWLFQRNGPAMTLSHPEQVEILP